MKKDKETRELELERTALFQKAVNSVANRLKLLHGMCLASDILLNDIDNALTFTDSKGMPIKPGFSRDKKKDYNAFLESVRNADRMYEKLMSADLVKSTEGDFHLEEGYRQDANEIIRLLMLYIDRVNDDRIRMFYEFLEGMPYGGVFPESMINRFSFEARTRIEK